MKQSVQNNVMSYQEIYEKEKRKEILKDSEKNMVRGEEGRKDETCREIAKVYCLSTQVQKFLSLNPYPANVDYRVSS
jgi:hypothetical protein